MNKAWIFEPFTSVGPVSFGMSRIRVRETLGRPRMLFRKSVNSDSDSDDYSSQGLHLYYNNKDVVVFIEAFVPARIVYKSISLLDQSLLETVSELVNIGIYGKHVDNGIDFRQIGLTLIEHPEGGVDGASFYLKEYYD